MSAITSRDNPRVRRWRGLMRDARQRKKEGRAIIEGEHLVAACLNSRWIIEALIVGKSAAPKFANFMAKVKAPAILADEVFRSISDIDSPTGLAAEIALPAAKADLRSAKRCVFLEGIQDAGNVGTILRSAAAFGISHAVLGPGCADTWSPKVLRAGMGAHFAMDLLEGNLEDAVARFGGKLCCTVPRGGRALGEADLSGRIGWVFGSEGQGVSDAIKRLATLKVTIPMPGSAESLNVAAAAAICFYELSRRAARS